MVFGNPDVQVSDFLQYGSFGLLTLLVVWFMWKAGPALVAKFEAIITAQAESNQAAITKLVDEFRVEADQCREERLQVAKEAASEREKDRTARQEIINNLQKVVDAVERKVGGK